MKCVQFSDEAQTEVVAIFGCDQDEGAYPHLGTLEDDDPLIIAFMALVESERPPL